MGKKGRRKRNKKKNSNNNQQQAGGAKVEKDGKLDETAQQLLDTFTSQSGDLQEHSKKIFDSIFQNLLGGQTSKKLTREEILQEKQETLLVIEEVNENIEKVNHTFGKIKEMKIQEIEGINDIPDPIEDDTLKGIELTKKQHKKLKKNDKNYSALDSRESMLVTKKTELEKILAKIPGDSVCHKFEEEILRNVKSDIEKTQEFKKLVAVQQIPEILAKKLEVKEAQQTEDMAENQ